MRLLVVSDIHSNLMALEAVLDDAKDWDAAICAGDTVGYGPNPKECINLVINNGVHCVQGNHDRAVTTIETDWFNDDVQEAISINRSHLPQHYLEWLSALPIALSLDFEGTKVAIYHGSPVQPLTSYIYSNDATAKATEYLALTGADVIILGHTHIPYTVLHEGRIITNPGSVGQPRDGDPKASYMILETDDLKTYHRRVEYCIDATVAAIDALGIPHRFASRLYRGF